MKPGELLRKPGPLTPEERERLLNQLRPEDRELILSCMRSYPKFTAAKAIEFLTAFGGL